MSKQITLFPCDSIPFEPKPESKVKRNWENAFQRWCNKEAQDETNPTGICGYSSICDYCVDNSYGRPCVRALNSMCRDELIHINYNERDFEKIWDM